MLNYTDSGGNHGTSLCCSNSWTCDSIDGPSQWDVFGPGWRGHGQAHIQTWHDGNLSNNILKSS